MPRDDFTAFADSEHMFYGLHDPFVLIRDETTRALREQVPDTHVESIAVVGKPKWLTIGRRLDEGDQIVVTYFGVCFQARIAVAFGDGHENLEATVTFLFGRWDTPEEQRLRTYFDLAADAVCGFEDDTFRARFLAFREADP